MDSINNKSFTDAISNQQYDLDQNKLFKKPVQYRLFFCDSI
jgi:hypothetical protein